MLVERDIQKKWVAEVVANPLKQERRTDGTIHYLGQVPARQGRVMRVIARREKEALRVITTFFDRREKRGI
jgi:hypothetical protein